MVLVTRYRLLQDNKPPHLAPERVKMAVLADSRVHHSSRGSRGAES